MGTKIADMVALSALTNSDLFEIEQSGVSKKISWSQTLSLMPFQTDGLIPLGGDIVGLRSATRVSGSPPQWRIIPSVAYTATSPTATQITFNGGVPLAGVNRKATDYFAVGDVVRTTISGTNYYAIVSAVTTTTLTLAGASLPLLSTITQLAIGRRSMVRRVRLSHHAATYNATVDKPVTKGCMMLWQGPPAFLVEYDFAHMNTAANTGIQIFVNEIAAAAMQLTAAGTASTYGNFVKSGALTGNVAISHGQRITVYTPTLGGLADFLIVNLTLVVP